MTDRPAWIPDDIADEDVERWSQTLGGHLARIEYEATRLGDSRILARCGRVRDVLARRRDAVLREHWDGR